MPKAYWIAVYRAVNDPSALVRYAELAGPAIRAQGGRFLARGAAAFTFEGSGGDNQRTVLIEFDSVEQAERAYRSEAYAAAVAVLAGAVDREVRIVEALPPA